MKSTTTRTILSIATATGAAALLATGIASASNDDGTPPAGPATALPSVAAKPASATLADDTGASTAAAGSTGEATALPSLPTKPAEATRADEAGVPAEAEAGVASHEATALPSESTKPTSAVPADESGVAASGR